MDGASPGLGSASPQRRSGQVEGGQGVSRVFSRPRGASRTDAVSMLDMALRATSLDVEGARRASSARVLGEEDEMMPGSTEDMEDDDENGDEEETEEASTSATVDSDARAWDGTGQTWEQVKVNQFDGEPPSQRSLHVAIVHQQAMYVFGGYTGRERVNSMHRFDFLSSTWHCLDDSGGEPPGPRDRHTAVVANDLMLIFGGYDGIVRRNDSHAFDLNRGRWVEIELLSELVPSARHSHAACSSQDKMYITCGYDGSYRNDLFEFSMAEERRVSNGHQVIDGEWRRVLAKGRYPQARYRATCCFFEDSAGNGKLVLFGGHNGSTHLHDTHIFDVKTETWSSVRTAGNVPLPRDSHCAVVFERSMLVFGGSCGQPLNDFSSLDLETMIWRPIQGDSWTPCARFCSSAVVYDGSFYLFGGYDSSDRLRDIQRFKFAPSVCSVERSSLITDLGRNAFSEFLSDMVFVVNGAHCIPAHRFFVMRCTNLAELEGADAECDEDGRLVVRVDDKMRIDVFKDFINYLYTDKVQLESSEFALEMFAIAEHFEVQRLRRICLNFVSAALTVASAANALQAADKHRITELREKALHFIVRNFDQVSKTHEFEEMGRTNVELVFEVLRNRGGDVAAHENFTPESLCLPVNENEVQVLSYASNVSEPDRGTWMSEQSKQWVSVALSDGSITPGKRSLHAMAVYKDNILLFGGYNGEERVNDFFVFSLKTRKWEMIEVTTDSDSGPSPRDRHTMVVVDDALWIFGGYNGTCRVNDLYMFGFRGNTWTKIPDIDPEVPSPRHSHCSCSSEAKHALYVFGGYDGNYLNDLYEFSSQKQTWKRLPHVGLPPSPRYRASLVCAGHHLVCSMGHDGYHHLNDLYTYDLESNTWASLPTSGPSPAPRDSHTACVLGNNQMIIFGGSSGSSLNCMHRLRFQKNIGQWSRVACTGMLPASRFCHSSVIVDKTMYVYGGYDGTNRLEDWIEYSFGEQRVSHVPRSTIVGEFASLVANQQYSDVTFVVEGKRIPAHKVICIRCDYFRVMFATDHGFKESQENEISIGDIRYEIFLMLLRYIYTDRQDITLSSAMELFIAADRFGIERLKSMCENKMLAAVTIESVAELFAAAELHNASSLYSRCLYFIVQNFDDVSKTKGFEEMGRANIDLIFTVLRSR